MRNEYLALATLSLIIHDSLLIAEQSCYHPIR